MTQLNAHPFKRIPTFTSLLDVIWVYGGWWVCMGITTRTLREEATEIHLESLGHLLVSAEVLQKPFKRFLLASTAQI